MCRRAAFPMMPGGLALMMLITHRSARSCRPHRHWAFSPSVAANGTFASLVDPHMKLRSPWVRRLSVCSPCHTTTHLYVFFRSSQTYTQEYRSATTHRSVVAISNRRNELIAVVGDSRQISLSNNLCRLISSSFSGAPRWVLL